MSEQAVARLRKRAKDPAPIVWNFLGDSITHGAVHTWGRRDYVELFDERVRFQLRRRDDIVINGASSGFTIGNIAEGLEHRCLRFRPDVVGIAVGMNDCVAGRDGIGAFESAYRAVIERIGRETDALIFLQTQNRVLDAYAESRSTLPDYTEVVRRIAGDLGLPWCDHYRRWQEAEGTEGMNIMYLLDDAIHPNADGHVMMADTLLDWLDYGRCERRSPLD